MLPAILVVSSLVSCGRMPVDGRDSQTKTVSLPEELYYFTPDAASFAAIESRSRSGRRVPAATGGVAKSAAKIDPAEIKVLVTWSDHDNEDLDADHAYMEEFWSSADRDHHRWQDQVDYYAGHPTNEIVFHGTLKREGDYATGEVVVRKGSNSVLIGFLDAAGMVPVEAWAEYHWPTEEGEGNEGWYSPMGQDSDTLRFSPVSATNQ
jgi:hypothetical protein